MDTTTFLVAGLVTTEYSSHPTSMLVRSHNPYGGSPEHLFVEMTEKLRDGAQENLKRPITSVVITHVQVFPPK